MLRDRTSGLGWSSQLLWGHLLIRVPLGSLGRTCVPVDPLARVEQRNPHTSPAHTGKAPIELNTLKSPYEHRETTGAGCLGLESRVKE